MCVCGSFRVCAYQPEPVDAGTCGAYQLSKSSAPGSINIIGSRRLPHINALSSFLIFFY